jgi:hypothetical protein
MGESSDSGGGGNDEPQGTVFGVDGVSKTGSTSQDQQIGYTDGQGGKGSNYDALQGATSQQTSAAVAAANKTKASGGNETAQQAAVSNVLESYDPGFVNRSGNLTKSGQNAINQAAQEAIEDTAEFERIQASAPPAGAALANIGDVTQPSMDQNLLTSLDLGPQASLADPEAAALRSRVPDPTAPLTVAEERNLVNMFSEAGLDPAAGQEAERQRQAQQQQALNAVNNMLGITTLPEAATAAAVLQGSIPEFDMDDREGDYLLNPSLRPAPMTLPVPPPADRRQQRPIGRSMGGANELFGGTGTTAPASDFLARNPQPDAGGNLVNPLLQTGTAPMDVSGATTSAGLYGGYEDDPAYDADIFGVPRYAGGKTGLDGQMQGFSDARQMGDFVSSATEGNFLTDLMSFLPGLDPVEANRNNVRDMMEAGAQFNQESGKLELDTGRGTLRMSDSGTVTYSGMPNPDYTGPFGNLVNPPAQTGDDGAMTTNVAKSPQDPCPPGYQLVNGVCQPVDDVTTAPPGSGFQFFPSGGFPTSFQPVTQATQVGQINPFVLRPNVPQGIQGLSPTGAALGRQV